MEESNKPKKISTEGKLMIAIIALGVVIIGMLIYIASDLMQIYVEADSLENFYVSDSEYDDDIVEKYTTSEGEVFILRTSEHTDNKGMKWETMYIPSWGISVDAPKVLVNPENYDEVDLSYCDTGKLVFLRDDIVGLEIEYSQLGNLEYTRVTDNYNQCESSEEINDLHLDDDEQPLGEASTTNSQGNYIVISGYTGVNPAGEEVVGYKYTLLRKGYKIEIHMMEPTDGLEPDKVNTLNLNHMVRTVKTYSI